MNFKDLNLCDPLLKALSEEGYNSPTPIQEKAIPLVLEGKDLRASAETGTGKTAAFILPSLHILSEKPAKPGTGPRILILVPTRELAMQVAKQSSKYSKHMRKTKTVCIYGGAPYPVQNKDLSRPYEILVATPGRLIDHIERGRIDFSRIELFILDEADRMLDMGFVEPVEEIASHLPKTRQTLLFSATLKGPVLKLSQKLMNNPVELAVAPKAVNHDQIEQKLYMTDDISHKHELLTNILQDELVSLAIVFTSTKRNADQLVDMLNEQGIEAAALHGDMNQRQRTKTMTAFRNGKVTILVATDVAARGLDVQNVSHVVNFDLPHSEEDYVHRIGRTGRAGNKGIALSFASHKDRQVVDRIEKYISVKLARHTIPGLEPKKAEPKKPAPGGAPKRPFPRFGDRKREGGFRRGGYGDSRPPRGESRGESRDAPRGPRRDFNDAPRGPRKEFSDAPREPRGDFAPRSPKGSFFNREGSKGDFKGGPRSDSRGPKGEFRSGPKKDFRGPPKGKPSSGRFGDSFKNNKAPRKSY